MGRQNTFRINYGNLPNKPGLGKVQKFCANELGLKSGEVIRFQNSRALGVTFVTVTDIDLAQKVCVYHGRRHEITGSDGKKYPVILTLEDGAVEVKLYDLSEDVSNADVVNFLEKYGTVRRVYEERLGDDQDFPGAFTGIRIARMVVNNNIDSWVTINGELTQVTYFGQRQTCRHCRDYLHIGATCVQNKKLQVQKSYADAAKQPAANQPARKKNPSAPNKPTPEKPLTAPESVTPNNGTPAPQNSNKSQTKTPTNNTGTAAEKQTEAPAPPFLKPPAPGWSQQDDILANPFGRKSFARTDGNDTDTSLASSTSSKRSTRGRPPGKKPRSGDNEREDEEAL